jgi:hypothetical protein
MPTNTNWPTIAPIVHLSLTSHRTVLIQILSHQQPHSQYLSMIYGVHRSRSEDKTHPLHGPLNVRQEPSASLSETLILHLDWKHLNYILLSILLPVSYKCTSLNQIYQFNSHDKSKVKPTPSSSSPQYWTANLISHVHSLYSIQLQSTGRSPQSTLWQVTLDRGFIWTDHINLLLPVPGLFPELTRKAVDPPAVRPLRPRDPPS